MKADHATSNEYQQRAAPLKRNVQLSLWYDSLQYFTDRNWGGTHLYVMKIIR